MMRRSKWFLAAFFVILGGCQVTSSNSPVHRSETALRSPKLTPLWHGVLCIVAGRYERTIAICNETLRSDPDCTHAYVLRGCAHLFKENEAQKAITDFSEAILRNPDNAAIHVVRAQACRKAKDYDRAIADCTEAIRIDPDYGEAYAWRGACYLGKRLTNKAIADFSLALRHNPFLAWARCGRAEAYRRRGESARALADLEEVLRDDPGNEQAHFNRCLVYLLNLRDLDRALAESSECIRLHPREPLGYMLRSMAYLAKGEKAKSLHDGATAVALKPEYLHLRCWHKTHSLSFGFGFGPGWERFAPWEDDHEKRIAACTKRLADDPNNVAAYYERAWAYACKRDFNKALADFNEVIGRDKADAEAYRERGHAHLCLEAYVEAIDDFNNAIRLDPSNADYYVCRATVYSMRKQYEVALHDYDAALRFDPRIAVAHDCRGWIYGNRGEYDKAAVEFTEALRLSPDDAETYARRAWVRRDQGKYEDGIADYKQALQINPQNFHARGELAWLQATAPEARLRNGKEARENATKACQASSWRDPIILSALAAACAECGDFEEAVNWQTKVLELAPKADKPGYRHRLELYRSHQPYHLQSASAVSAPSAIPE